MTLKRSKLLLGCLNVVGVAPENVWGQTKFVDEARVSLLNVLNVYRQRGLTAGAAAAEAKQHWAGVISNCNATAPSIDQKQACADLERMALSTIQIWESSPCATMGQDCMFQPFDGPAYDINKYPRGPGRWPEYASCGASEGGWG